MVIVLGTELVLMRPGLDARVPQQLAQVRCWPIGGLPDWCWLWVYSASSMGRLGADYYLFQLGLLV